MACRGTAALRVDFLIHGPDISHLQELATGGQQ
jgi:hypothetical protein